MFTPEIRYETRFYSVPEAALILGVSRSAVYAMIRRGLIPVTKIGKRVFIPKADFERLQSAS